MPTVAAIATAARSISLDRLERERFDCLVIGGGITGAGVAREASLRGLSVALVEARDFGSGTSSRSSKLIHGGLRYLAMGDVALVRSTALERKVIHRLAPHLAEPRWMVVPARSRVGLAKLRTAITTYEKLGAVEEADRHRNWTRDDLEAQEPLLRRDRFSWACVYREYLTDDARLVLANLRAAVATGATVLNHAPAVAFTEEAGSVDGAVVECALAGRRVRIRARCVINAAGPWVDEVRRLEDPEGRPRLHLSKGIHIVVPAARLPVRNMLILNAGGRRTVFVIRHGEVVFVGTTDTSFGRACETWPEICAGDVAYLLAPLARDLDTEPVRPEELVGAWAGLRPLIAEEGKAPSEISRKDEVWIGPKRVVTIAGGKLTGYRPMARATLETAAQACGLRLAPPPAEEPPLPGGDFEGDLGPLAHRLERERGLARPCAERLARLYGTEADAVLAHGAEPLAPGALVVAGEIAFGIEVEGAAHLEDVLYRRTRAALYALGDRDALVQAIADRMAGPLGWNAAQRRKEIEGVRALLVRDLAFQSDAA